MITGSLQVGFHMKIKCPTRRCHASFKPWSAALMLTLLTGCGVAGFSTSVGPSRQAVQRAPAGGVIEGIRIVEFDQLIARDIEKAQSRQNFAQILGDGIPVGAVIAPGDVLNITIWEAPPATLFSTGTDFAAISSSQVSRPSTLPEFLVDASGKIAVPFAGLVLVSGRTLPEIERDIAARLAGKAHLPQVIVRRSSSANANATVVGEVNRSTIIPLTPKGERLLDALAGAGGSRQPVGKVTLQITRGQTVASMSLQDVIRDPRQNIILQPNDVVTALFQPNSFTALGATGRNAEIEFEETGVTLAQALGRIGGLQDMRADPKGVFLFRWEDPASLGSLAAGANGRDDGKIPVIYRIDMKNPATYFAAQNFAMQNRDVIYISNSPSSDFQRFVGIISGAVLPIIAADNALRN